MSAQGPNRLLSTFACISVDLLGRSFDGIGKPHQGSDLGGAPVDEQLGACDEGAVIGS